MGNQKVNNLIQNGYEFSSVKVLNTSYQISLTGFWNIMGFVFLTGIISYLLGKIPYSIGSLLFLVIQPALGIGIYIVADKILHDKHFKFADFFLGLKKVFKLFGLSLLIWIIYFLIFSPIIGFLIFSFGVNVLTNLALFKEGLANTGYILLAFSLLLFAVVVYLSVSYMFAPLLAYFTDLNIWDSLEASRKIIGKRWFQILGLLLVFVLFYFLIALTIFAGPIGIIFFVILAFVTYPWLSCTIYVAYDNIVGTREEEEPELDLGEHFIVNE